MLDFGIRPVQESGIHCIALLIYGVKSSTTSLESGIPKLESLLKKFNLFLLKDS